MMIINPKTVFVFAAIYIVGLTGLPYNRPHLCENATWTEIGTTFEEIDVDCGLKQSVFIDDDDNVYSLCTDNQTLSVWWNGDNRNPSSISVGGIQAFSPVWVSAQREVYFQKKQSAGYIVKLSRNNSNETFVASFSGNCTGLLVDSNNTLYCSVPTAHRIDMVSLNGIGHTITRRAGTGTSGSTSTQLHWPWGIFVDASFNLYVADAGNGRIQRFRSRESNGTTVAGASIPNNLFLNFPSDIVLDASGHLYIADDHNSRIIRVTGNSYQCLIGCSGTGSAAHQFINAYSLRFDSHGNLYVADEYNRRIQKFFLTYNCKQHSFHRPSLCSNATWNQSGLTVVSNTTIQGAEPRGIFIDLNNTFYFAHYRQNYTLIWPEGNFSQNDMSLTSMNFHDYSGLFVDVINDIYFSHRAGGARVIRRSLNNSNADNITLLSGICYAIFVDVNDTLYCSLRDQHRVNAVFLRNTSSTPKTRAGNGTNGSAMNQLSRPWGIFVDINLNLYVADFSNNRIQRFRPNEYDAMTVAGGGTPNGLMLQRPTDVIVDGHNHLYIADNRNHRIIRITGNDYQCLAGGCLYGQGSSSYQLSQPYSLRFDSHGNLFVADAVNRRIQKFLLLSECGQVAVEPLPTECSMTTDATAVTSVTSSYHIVNNDPCHILQPCLNGGVCLMASNNSHGYVCSCQSGFNGTYCQFDQRVCTEETCRNQGTCHVLSNGTSLCLCELGWHGHRCEKRMDFCRNATCQNRGVCRNLFTGYQCECLGDSSSGRHCEIESAKTKSLRIFALSVAYIGIIVIISSALLIVAMDVLKYVFKIETSEKKKQKKMTKNNRQKLTVVHHVYVNGSN